MHIALAPSDVFQPIAGDGKLTGKLTTHVLDTARGCPASGMAVELFHLSGDHAHLITSVVTNADGRCDAPLLMGEAMANGQYELWFHVGAYFSKLGLPQSDPFLGIVPVRFAISDETAHYHVPLLVSPFGYSTYRGS